MGINNFRIIAIKTGDRPDSFDIDKKYGFDLNYIKNLKANTIYPFYNCYTFQNDGFREVEYLQEQDVNLYNNSNSKNELKVNINAIVGKNGSGKSTLIELLFWANYNIGAHLELLYNYEVGENYKANNSLKLEILYCTDVDKMYEISFLNGKIYMSDFKRTGNKFQFNKKKEIRQIKKLENFFYSLVVNYSHYALNTKEIGQWIKPLFHKNDGYQTPIVLNPMRTDGNIDINKENILLERRLQANLLEYVNKGEEKYSLRNIANGKIAKSFELTLKPKNHPFQSLYNSIEKELKNNYSKIINNKLSELKKIADDTGHIISLTKDKEELLKSTIEHVFTFSSSKDCCRDDEYLNKSIDYIYNKLEKIAKNYPQFESYLDEKESISEFNDYLNAIKNSSSHITFKVKGAILYLKYFNRIFKDNCYNNNSPFNISIDDLSNTIKYIKEQEGFYINTFMMSPPTFFKTKINLNHGLSLNSLSSGEKQRIHSLSSIIYHLINLNSVEKLKNSDIVSYNNINLILDEIELYYHPNWQRRYINDLLEYISLIDSNNLDKIKGLNITFLTHSPYILSDIPTSNILFLKNNEQTNITEPYEVDIDTFGANIHNLLKDGFFMDKGYIGEKAQKIINEIIEFINDNEVDFTSEDILKTRQKIKLIGEPIIKSKLLNLFDRKYPANHLPLNQLDRKIQIQKDFLKQLEIQRNAYNENN